jgi:hypothetical protein
MERGMLLNGKRKEDKYGKDTRMLGTMIFKTFNMILSDQVIQEALSLQTLMKLLNTGEMPFKQIRILVMKSLMTLKSSMKKSKVQEKDLMKKQEQLGDKKLKITTIQ